MQTIEDTEAITYLTQCGLSPREIAEQRGITREEVEQALVKAKQAKPATREPRIVRPKHRFC